MAIVPNLLKLCFWKLLNFTVGLVFLVFLVAFIIISLPVYIYRLLVQFVASYRYKRELGSPLNAFACTYGAEFLSKDFHDGPSRCALVTSTILHGTVPYDSVLEDIERKWIHSIEFTDDGKVALRYPELRQYIEKWKGFLFWKQDTEFSLRNHVKLHQASESKEDPEVYVSSLIENLINKPFPRNRSPWEVHIVHGYRNDKLLTKDKGKTDGEMTVFIMRLHHALADGLSVMSLEIEGLLGLSLEKQCPSLRQRSNRKSSLLRRAFSIIKCPFQFAADAGSLIGLAFHQQMNSPWHAPDERKRGKQLYRRTPLIPVEKITSIKEAFGVSFTSVLFSCASAALSENLKSKNEKQFQSCVEFLPVTTTLPLPRPSGQRYKLANRLTGSIVELPIKSGIDSKQRLEKCENGYQQAKTKLLPYLAHFLITSMGSHLAIVAHHVFVNQIISTGLSNFPGPTLPAFWMGSKVLNTDVTVGGLPGVGGLSIMTISYEGHVRISIAAENGVMSRKELDAIIKCMCTEIDHLYQLAKRDSRRQLSVSED